MEGNYKSTHISQYFGRSTNPTSGPQAGTSNSMNNGLRNMPSDQHTLNGKRGVQLMTVTRKPNTQNNTSTNISFPKATMQFHGIGNSDANSSKQPMDTSNVHSLDSGKHMESSQDVSLKQLTDQEKVRFLSGTIEKVMKWHRIMKDFCHYEVIGPVVSIQEGAIDLQKIMLLRDKKGPVLKIVHYMYDRIKLPNFHIGQVVRCVGRMICLNTLQAIVITEATEEEISFLPRLCAKCDQEIAIYQRDN